MRNFRAAVYHSLDTDDVKKQRLCEITRVILGPGIGSKQMKVDELRAE